jgi:UDP-N-acetylglucosamine:LPS N-acetylglucosamine transferase
VPSEGKIIGMRDQNARGLLIDNDIGHRTIDQLAECMTEYIQNPEILQIHRENAQKKGETMTWDRIFEQNLRLFRKIRERKLQNK